jgi:hypothetical protein
LLTNIGIITTAAASLLLLTQHLPAWQACWPCATIVVQRSVHMAIINMSRALNPSVLQSFQVTEVSLNLANSSQVRSAQCCISVLH